jgi:flagellar FliJ protein
MAKPFALLGLLRVRTVQQEQAAVVAATAVRHANSVRVRRQAVVDELGRSGDAPASPQVMMAIAAARSSAQGMLAELDALIELADQDAVTASADLADARSRTIPLEKMELRHRSEAFAEDLRVEQGALDEIATNAWHRAQTAV